MEISGLDRRRLHRAYRDGLSPLAVIETCYRRVEALADPGIFIHLEPLEATLTAAAALPPFDPERYPLWGLPFAVKDNIDIGGQPTTAACPAFAYMPEADAPVVARLRAAGAIPLGKTNLDQFATGLTGVRTPYPVPRNALDPRIVPGGSSSGSAVAVAQGLVTFALGTDTAGSGRVPAALNNIVASSHRSAPSHAGRRPRLPHPRMRLDLRHHHRRRLGRFATAAAFDPAEPYTGIAPPG
jgi:allophanate hydrolase